MAASASIDDFLTDLHDRHGGQALVEIDKSQSEVRFRDGKPTYLQVSVKLWLGVPIELIPDFPMRNRALYRVEGRGEATFEAGRHQSLSWGDACYLVLRGALDRAKPGASRLLDFDIPFATVNRMRRLLSGEKKNGKDEPPFVELLLPQNWT